MRHSLGIFADYDPETERKETDREKEATSGHQASDEVGFLKGLGLQA